MGLTIIGLLLFSIIFLSFLIGLLDGENEKLLKICFFFIPFSGVSLFNIPELTFYVLPFTVAAAAWISLQLIRLLMARSTITLDLNNSFVWLALLFVIAVSLSTLMPMIINGSDGYMGANADSGKYFPIRPSTLHLLQWVYVFIGVIFSIFVIGYLNTLIKIELMLRILLISAGIACIIGLIEIVAFYSGLDYLTGWYHTVPTSEGAEKGVRIDGLLNIPRINSVSYETSNFAQHMIVIYAFIYYCRSKKVIIFSHFKDRSLAMLILIALLVCLSSTALFGLVIIYALNWATSSWTLKRFFRVSLGISFLVPVLYLGYMQVEFVTTIIDTFVLNKFSSGSADSRFSVAVNAFELFLRHPAIGVGFGVQPASDLVVMLLSGVGVFGFTVFLLLVLVIIYRGYHRSPKNVSPAMKDVNDDALSRIVIITNALTFAFVVLLIIYQGTGFTFRFGDFWGLSALVVSSYLVRDRAMMQFRAKLRG